MTVRDVLCPVVVGRENELAALDAAMSAAADGAGRVVFLAGEAGIGKSRLVREVVRRARERGMATLVGRALERTTTTPFRALAEALAGVALDGRIFDDPRLTAARGALAWLLPGEPSPSAEASELVVSEALTRLLGVQGGRQGSLLVLEDLHWTDPETLAVIEYLCDHLGRQPALCVATVRTGEDSGIDDRIRLLAERRVADLVPLRRLDGSGVDAMLRSCLGANEVPVDIASFIRARAEGVPLFVEELLSGLVESDALIRNDGGWRVVSRLAPAVPLTFRDTIRRRLERLGPQARAVVDAAATLGRRFDWSLLPAATGLDEAAVVAALRELTATQLIVTDDDTFCFRHALSREVVLAERLPPERARLAAAALAALDAAHPDPVGEWDDLSAELAERSGQRERAATDLLRSARRALRRGALGTADAALARAGDLAGDREALALEIDEIGAYVAALRGDADTATQRARSVLAAGPPQGQAGPRRSGLALALARAALAAGRWQDADHRAAEARGYADEEGEDANAAEADALAAQVAIAEGRVGAAADVARRAVAIGQAAAAPAAVCEGLEVLGRCTRPHDLEAAEAYFRRALDVAERHDLALWAARAMHELGTIDLLRGTRRGYFEAARDAAADAGATGLVALCELHVAAISAANWETETAIEAAERCVDLSRGLGLNTLGMGLVHLGAAHAQAGDEAAMERALEAATEFAPTEVDVAAGAPGRARMKLALRRADLEAARRFLDEAAAVLAAHPAVAFPFWGLRALLHAILPGDAPEAAYLQARAAAGRDHQFNRHTTTLAAAVLAGRAGDREEAERRRLEATALDPGVGGPWRAMVSALIGSAELTDGWGEGARDVREALAVFDEHGLEELASWCRAVLRDAGEPVPRRGRGESHVPPELRGLGVTSREVDVLALLRESLTNREIAGRLHLSPRTVDRHVANLLTKTAASDRGELADLARDADVRIGT